MAAASKSSRQARRKDTSVPAAAAGVAALDGLFQGLARNDAPGLVVGVAQQGRTVYRRAFGMASIALGLANTPATRMRIGSSSKHVTCLAAFLLAEEGKLDIDAPIGSVIPELPPLQGRPTLRQLMQHTGGLRDYLDLATTAAGLALQPPGRALAAQARQTDVNFAPGQRQLYCNGGYHLLSLAIERAAGQPFEQVLRTRIFEPLGLHDTSSEPSDMTLVPGTATLHVPVPGGSDGAARWRRGIFPTEEVRGEGAMVSTLDDMLRWLAHLRECSFGTEREQGRGDVPRQVGSAATWQQMLSPPLLPDGQRSTYACGLWRHAHRGLEIVHHSGSVYGGASQLLTVPAHALDVVILANGAPVSPTELSKRIVEAMLAAHLRGKPARMAGAGRHAHLAGARWVGEMGLVIGLDAVAGKLGISLQGSPAAPILRDEGDVLRVGFEDVAMGPFVLRKADLAAAAGGKPPGQLPITESGQLDTYQRLPSRPPATSRVAAPLLGHYRSTDLDCRALLLLEPDGSFVMRLHGPAGSREYTLVATSSRVFLGTARDPLMPDRLALCAAVEGGRVSGFRISTARTRRVLFTRTEGSA